MKCWMRRICYNDSVYHPLAKYVLSAKPTTLAQRHMDQHSYDFNGNPNLPVERQFADNLLVIRYQSSIEQSTLHSTVRRGSALLFDGPSQPTNLYSRLSTRPILSSLPIRIHGSTTLYLNLTPPRAAGSFRSLVRQRARLLKTWRRQRVGT